VPENSKQIRAPRQPKGPFDDLREFIGICASARKAMSPEVLKANVGKFIGELPEDSKDLLQDLAGLFRRPGR